MLPFPSRHSKAILDGWHPASGMRRCSMQMLSNVMLATCPQEDIVSVSTPRGPEVDAEWWAKDPLIGWLMDT